MKWVVLGDECVLAALPERPGMGGARLPRPEAVTAIVRLNQAGYTVVLASHYRVASPDDNETPSSALQYAFWHALAEAGAHVSAVFFWPEDATDTRAGSALFHAISARYELGTRHLIALFSQTHHLEAARLAGCHTLAVDNGPVAQDLTACVAQITAQPACADSAAANPMAEPPAITPARAA